MLLYRPDKNALEWKALAAACDALKTNPVELLAACGAIPSTHEFHFNRFLAEAFPQGAAFPDWGALPASAGTADGRAARVLDRRRDDDRDRRRVLGARAAERPLRGRHPHRVPGAVAAARQRARPHRARAAVDRVHARAQAHDAAGRGDRARSRCRKARRRRRCRSWSRSPPTACRSGTRRACSACRSPPTCGSTPWATRSPTTCRRPPIRRGRRSCACCGSSRGTCRRSAARTT